MSSLQKTAGIKNRNFKSDWCLAKRKLIHLVSVSLFILSSFLIVTPGYPVAAATSKSDPDFEAGFFHDNQGGTLPYRLLKPLSADLPKIGKYPLVIFLHGSGERGSDNKKQLKYIGQVFAQTAFRLKYPCFVIAPQCPQDQNWVYKESYSGTVPESPEPAKPLWQTMQLVRELQKELPIDPGRLYVIGFSSGGSGVWDLIVRYPQMFAAAAPFSGCGDDRKAYLMVNVPIWAFHGGRDLIVNPNTTRMMIAAIREAGGHPKYTEYSDLYHNTWDRTFGDPEFFQWLFAQNK
jgi:Predicted peptidase